MDLRIAIEMKTLVSMLGIAATAALMAALYLNAPSAGPVEAHEDKADGCPMTEVAVDEGYGVTLTMLRPVCAKAP
jgi:Flp pilus assembly protein CpaB